METKTLILSSSGLKNVIFSKTKDVNDLEEFRFILGKEELKTNYLFAEFISPRVSRIHQTDPTINYLNFADYSHNSESLNSNIHKTILDQVDQLSRGNSIEITKEMIKDLQQISIFLGNIELFTKLSELFESKNDEELIEKFLISLQFTENDIFIFNFEREKEQENVIDYIASHFYMIEEEKLLKIPKNILYLIISNEKLQLKDEDSLLDFIDKLFDQNDDEITKTIFYENVEFKSLSEEKMKQFIFKFNANEMATNLWQKLIECFYSNSTIVKEVKTVEERMTEHKTRYYRFNNNKEYDSSKYKNVKYENNQENQLKGIITKIGRGNPSNAINEKLIDVSSSSLDKSSYSDMNNVFNFNDDQKIFESENKPNSWFCCDFKERKVKLSHYLLRSHGFDGKTNNRIKT